MKPSPKLGRRPRLAAVAAFEAALDALVLCLAIAWVPSTFAEDDAYILRRLLVEIDGPTIRELSGQQPGDGIILPWFDDSTLAAVVRSARENQNTLELSASVEGFEWGR